MVIWLDSNSNLCEKKCFHQWEVLSFAGYGEEATTRQRREIFLNTGDGLDIFSRFSVPEGKRKLFQN